MSATENATALPTEVRIANKNSHYIGVVDDCYRCLDCEVLVTNAWKYRCGGNTLDAAWKGRKNV